MAGRKTSGEDEATAQPKQIQDDEASQTGTNFGNIDEGGDQFGNIEPDGGG